jgi:hypothetical protein
LELVKQTRPLPHLTPDLKAHARRPKWETGEALSERETLRRRKPDLAARSKMACKKNRKNESSQTNKAQI